MKRPIKIFVAVAVFLLLWSSALPLWAQQRQYSEFSEDGVPIAADVLLVRPLGLVSMILGAVGYVITYPFAAVTDPPSVDVTAEQLVNEPTRFTFQRPLGASTYKWTSGDQSGEVPMQWYGEYLWRVAIEGAPAGTLSYQACAVDAAGNQACSEMVEVEVK